MGQQVTKDAYDRMSKKLKEMKGRRARLSKIIGEARDHGDLKENSAYHEAKKDQGLNEMRIKELDARVDSAEIVDPSKMPKSDTVKLGTTVKIVALDNKRQYEYTIVPEIDADAMEDRISTDSPVGGAVIRAKVGDVVEAELPRGKVKFKILKIK